MLIEQMHEFNPSISLAPDYIDPSDSEEFPSFSQKNSRIRPFSTTPSSSPYPNKDIHITNGNGSFISPGKRRESFPMGMLPLHLVPEEEARIEEARRREERERSNNYNPDNVRVRIVSHDSVETF